MGLPLYVDFAPFAAKPAATSLALANPSPVSVTLTAHVHIGRFASEVARLAHPNKSLLLDKGITRCPCDLDLDFTQIESHLEGEGAGADVFVQPVLGASELRLDVYIERSSDGKDWTSELLLPNCTRGALRKAQIPELAGKRARIRLHCVSPNTLNGLVRIWANDPRRQPMAQGF